MEENKRKIYLHYLKAYSELLKANSIEKNVLRARMIEALEAWMKHIEERLPDLKGLRNLYLAVSSELQTFEKEPII